MGELDNKASEESEWWSIDGLPILVSEPENKPVGLTFLITESKVSLNCYRTIQQTLLSLNHVVIGVSFRPWLMRNHGLVATQIHNAFHNVLRNEYRLQSYAIIGHGVGGKIALLVPSLYPSYTRLKLVLALDPIDKHPEFTNPDEEDNLHLPSHYISSTKFFITNTNTSGASTEHNGAAVYRRNQSPHIKLIEQDGASHLSAYCDTFFDWSVLCVDNSIKKLNETTLRQTTKLIRTHFNWGDNDKNKVKSKSQEQKQSIHEKMDECQKSLIANEVGLTGLKDPGKDGEKDIEDNDLSWEPKFRNRAGKRKEDSFWNASHKLRISLFQPKYELPEIEEEMNDSGSMNGKTNVAEEDKTGHKPDDGSGTTNEAQNTNNDKPSKKKRKKKRDVFKRVLKSIRKSVEH